MALPFWQGRCPGTFVQQGNGNSKEGDGFREDCAPGGLNAGLLSIGHLLLAFAR